MALHRWAVEARRVIRVPSMTVGHPEFVGEHALPTFYLNADQLGITGSAHAIKIAQDILGSDDVEVIRITVFEIDRPRTFRLHSTGSGFSRRADALKAAKMLRAAPPIWCDLHRNQAMSGSQSFACSLDDIRVEMSAGLWTIRYYEEV